MSSTVRLYTDAELETIKNGSDKMLATIFMNSPTFTAREIKFYPYHLRRLFVFQLTGVSSEIHVYATDPEHAKKFVELEHNTREYPVESIDEIILSRQGVNIE